MHHKMAFYGPVTVGAKGQIVIPAEARAQLGVATGHKLVVFGMPERNMLGICPVESVESLLGELTKKLRVMRKAIDSTKGGN